MSGDVQPRKRKDKKRKKDELGLEEPRGTAAALGEGDVFMHSYSDHGTGGHWCAKVIFFSLLAVLITLIGLIILENRGLSELEANAVESRYSGVLEGWLEDTPDDDHHDEHTLDLKHHDDDEDDHDDDGHELDDHDDKELEDDDEHADDDEEGHEDDEDEGHDEDEGDEEDEETEGRDDYEIEDRDDDDEANEDEDDEDREDENDEQEDSQEQDVEPADDEDDDDRQTYKYYDDNDDDEEAEKDEDENNDNDDDEQEIEQDDDDGEGDENESKELENKARDDDAENDEENDDKEDEEEHEDEEEEDEEIEVEKIEREASEEEPISTELPALPEEDDDDDDDDKDEDKDMSAEGDDDDDDTPEDDVDDDDDAADDDDFLEADDVPPVVVRVTAPAGKPFIEVEEDDTSSEKPPATLEEEEEYEKQQEELRREEEQSSSHIWLKVSVGGALLAATHALVRRAAAPRDEPDEEHEAREETPVVDRRMTLIPERPVVPKNVLQESAKPMVQEVVKQAPAFLKSAPVVKQESEDEEEVEEPEDIEEEEVEEIEAPKKAEQQEKDKELYSDEEEVQEKKVEPIQSKAPEPEPEPEDEVPDDVEIIDDEQLEEELEEEEDDISDVDDAELLSRLEAKYGRLPEPHRPGQQPKDGGNSIEDDWPGEPSDAFWRQQLDSAEQQLRQGDWMAAATRAGAPELHGSARARHVVALALDRAAEAARDNRLLSRAIAAYLELLKMNEHLSDKKLIAITQRTLDRIQFRGNYFNAEPVYRLLIRRFPDEPGYRNNLTISFLMSNRADLAEEVLKETLTRWPNDRVALAHYGFVLKTLKNKLEEAVDAFQKALDGDKGPACEPRFYYHYGDALLLLGRYEEAHEVHKRGAKHGHFLSPAQRSLYNVRRLKSRPWWNVQETPYSKLALNLEKSWKDILKEGEAAKALYEKEKEGLKERGEWSQMDLFVRGQEIPGRCERAPVTCSIVRAEVAAGKCRRGQVKFSAMEAGTHVRPHVGPTNCRLRMHLGLSNTKDTYLRVDKETRQWQEGKVLLFDDSFEHEVWHNGTGKRLVLIVDVWHPDLTPAERRSLPAI